jgi:hypothetical protein
MTKQEEERSEDKQQSDVVVSPFDAIRHNGLFETLPEEDR